MAEIWEQNEEVDEEHELVATDHRDRDEELVDADAEQEVETDADDPRDALAELGEDVASSPARRGHDNDTDDEGDENGDGHG
ncbi:hypothetical protein NHL51_02795 [Leucobacter sp. gxy201]|uniref:hypothetical protein n=1 Tax=Leucobacter sp. gxy201 TaxID=2957200 RepID=UPI003DA1A29A